MNSETDSQHSHQGFISQRINDGADHRLLIPLSGDPAIDQVSDTSVEEKTSCPCMSIMNDKIANDRCSYQTRESENIRNRVYVLMCQIPRDACPKLFS